MAAVVSDFLGGLAVSYADIPAVVSRRVDNTEMRLLAALRYKPFRKVIAISQAVAEVLAAHDVERGRIVVIRDAVDFTAFAQQPDCAAFRREFGIEEGDFVIAAAGQLIPRKGHRYLLQAMADLAIKKPQVKLLICGDGYLKNQLRAQVTSLGLGEVVQFAGFRDDLDDFIACLDLLVHPALAEGLGVVTLKAAAAGVPVVGFDAGGLQEAVIHGKTGLLVPAGDVTGLWKAMATLVGDERMRLQMGAAGRERMQNEFSIATMADKHIALYESVLNG